ncbi:MAG: aspartyl protease family protein [Lentimonas sp.]|jgi:aspartyl protease family protein
MCVLAARFLATEKNNMSFDQTPQFIYLAILLVFIASSLFFNKRIKASKMLAQLAIWVIIILVILGLYSFRFEFINLKNRIIGELFPSKVARIGDGKIAINMSKNGHFYINILVNGNKVRFMVDTGASDIVLNYSDAKKSGIDFKEISSFRKYQTANGLVMKGVTTIREMSVGEIKFNDFTVAISNKDMGTSLLGMSFLNKFSKYEFYQDRLILSY